MRKRAPNPGRIPTAKGSIRFKSKKDYGRGKNTVKVWKCLSCKNMNDVFFYNCQYCSEGD